MEGMLINEIAMYVKEQDDGNGIRVKQIVKHFSKISDHSEHIIRKSVYDLEIQRYLIKVSRGRFSVNNDFNQIEPAQDLAKMIQKVIDEPFKYQFQNNDQFLRYLNLKSEIQKIIDQNT